MAQVTGIVFVKVDGVLTRSMEGAALDFGGKERKAVKGHSLYGFSEAFKEAMVTFKLAHVGGDDLIGMQAKISSTLEFKTDTGDTFMVRNAFCTKPAKLTGGGGEVEFEFAGDPAEKI